MEIDPTQFFAGAGMIATMIVGFGSVMRKIGRLEQKFDQVWSWYQRLQDEGVDYGRRRTDPPRGILR